MSFSWLHLLTLCLSFPSPVILNPPLHLGGAQQNTKSLNSSAGILKLSESDKQQHPYHSRKTRDKCSYWTGISQSLTSALMSSSRVMSILCSRIFASSHLAFLKGGLSQWPCVCRWTVFHLGPIILLRVVCRSLFSAFLGVTSLQQR